MSEVSAKCYKSIFYNFTSSSCLKSYEDLCRVGQQDGWNAIWNPSAACKKVLSGSRCAIHLTYPRKEFKEAKLKLPTIFTWRNYKYVYVSFQLKANFWKQNITWIFFIPNHELTLKIFYFLLWRFFFIFPKKCVKPHTCIASSAFTANIMRQKTYSKGAFFKTWIDRWTKETFYKCEW